MRLGYRFLAALLCVLSAFGASGCSGEGKKPDNAGETEHPVYSGSEYTVDYGGRKDAFLDAEDTYPSGQTVTVYYDFRRIGTDTDYSFYLDGERLNCIFETGKGYVIRFVMPEHDVKLECRSSNSMMALEIPEEPAPEFQAPGEEALRVEYTHEEIRTDGMDGYALRVYEYDDSRACLELEIMNGRSSYYLVPKELIADCRAVAEENGMGQWADLYEKVPYETPGGYTYRRFYCGGDGGEKILADVGRMPRNGNQVLDQLRDLLWTYATVTYALQPPAWG